MRQHDTTQQNTTRHDTTDTALAEAYDTTRDITTRHDTTTPTRHYTTANTDTVQSTTHERYVMECVVGLLIEHFDKLFQATTLRYLLTALLSQCVTCSVRYLLSALLAHHVTFSLRYMLYALLAHCVTCSMRYLFMARKPTSIGTTPMMVQWLVQHVTHTDAKVCRMYWIANKEVGGRNSSTLPMSFEKRFIILPEGLVS